MYMLFFFVLVFNRYIFLMYFDVVYDLKISDLLLYLIIFVYMNGYFNGLYFLMVLFGNYIFFFGYQGILIFGYYLVYILMVFYFIYG